MNKKRVLSNVLWACCFLIAIVLSFKSLREPDLWWMFRVGEWMTENGKVPTTDMLSFTHEGVDWISVKWIFELLAYGVASSIGPEFIVILQTIVNVLLLLFLRKVYLNLKELFQFSPSSYLESGFFLSILLFLFGLDFRMISRPEMTSHLLTLVYISLFLQYRNKNGKSIFWLIPIQIFWTNAHEAYGTGMVILGIFIAGELIEWWFNRNERKPDQKLLLASIGAILATAINPRGFYMLIHPYVIFTQVKNNQYTSELHSAFSDPIYYFGFKDPWIMITVYLIATIGLVLMGKNLKGIKRIVFSQIGVGYTLALIAFFYLGLTGHRNVPFPIVVATPLVGITFYLLYQKLNTSKQLISFYLSIVLGVVFYIGVVSGTHYQLFNSFDRYGIRTYAEKNPAGAAQFIQENNISGSCFSDYLTSAYFLWELRPDFKSFIDLRDLDVYSMDFFNEFAAITYYPQKFEQTDQEYDFNHVILYRPQFAPLHQHLYQSENWELVYADPIAVVYLKNTDQNAKLIEKYGIKQHPKGIFSKPYQPAPATISTGLSTLFNPLYDTTQTDDYHLEQIANEYYQMVGDFDKALQYAFQLSQSENQVDGYALLGNTYMKYAEVYPDRETKSKLIQSALSSFRAGHKIDKKDYACLLGQGWVAANSNQYLKAIKWLEKAEKIRNDDPTLYQLKAQCSNSLISIQKQKAQQHITNWFAYMEKAHQLTPKDQHIIVQLLVGHCQRNECEQILHYADKFNQEPWMKKGDIDFIKDCIAKCTN